MAVMDIERNELSALASHRSGSPARGGFSDFLGIGAGKKKAAANEAEAKKKLVVIPEKATCEWLEAKLADVQSEIQAINAKISAGEKQKWYSSAIAAFEENANQIRKKMNTMACEAKKEAAAAAAEQAGTVAALKEATAGVTVQKSNTLKYLGFGLGGLLLVAGVFVAMKRK